MAHPGAAWAMAFSPCSTRGQKASRRLNTAISAAPSSAAWMAMAEAAPPPAQQDDFLPRYLNSVAPEVLGVAATVGVVAHQDAVLIDDGIHRLDGLGRRGQLVQKRDHRVFAQGMVTLAPRIPRVRIAATASPGPLRRNIKGQIGPVQAEFLKAVVVHAGDLECFTGVPMSPA